jgi:hypothetical protein
MQLSHIVFARELESLIKTFNKSPIKRLNQGRQLATFLGNVILVAYVEKNYCIFCS